MRLTKRLFLPDTNPGKTADPSDFSSTCALDIIKKAYVDTNTRLEVQTGVQKGEKRALTPEARTTERVQACWGQETPPEVPSLTNPGFAEGLEHPGLL